MDREAEDVGFCLYREDMRSLADGQGAVDGLCPL